MDTQMEIEDIRDWESLGAVSDDFYERIEIVGQGTAGTAYRARHKESGMQVVVKEVSLEGLNEDEQRTARNEVEVLRGLDHPNIVRLEDSYETGDKLVIVTEYCEEGDLETYLDSLPTPLPLAATMRYFAQLCMAVLYLHEHCILHRDLKTANVFLCANGVCKIGDFGIAKSLPNQAAFTSTMVGTPFYFSPEVCEGQQYDSKSDVWALGVILYQLLMLRQPFQAGNIMALVNLITNTSPEPLPSSIPLDTVELVSQLLEKSPQTRPSIRGVIQSPVVQRYVHELQAFENVNGTVQRTARQEAKRNKMKLQKALLEETQSSSVPGAVWTISPGAGKKETAQLVSGLEPNEERKCEQCTTSSSTAETHCIECGFYLCHSCSEKLHSMRSFQNHHIAILPKTIPNNSFIQDLSTERVEDVEDIMFIPNTEPERVVHTPVVSTKKWVSGVEGTTSPVEPNVLSLMSSGGSSTSSRTPQISENHENLQHGRCCVVC